ncbi:MAG: DUF3667 domain-containing protein [Marinifilaceae bacterium]|jgi:hypothetical protein|nr:DUF3667 domain-containing protein [Marinifilaceae bacterium]
MTSQHPTDQDYYYCKNCNTGFKGNFCPNCGQSKKEFEKPFKFLIMDFVGNIVAFDTRFWKTLLAILFKPGQLAIDYVKGHRARYMPPFRFYIFISFFLFLSLNYYSTNIAKDKIKIGDDLSINIGGEEKKTEIPNNISEEKDVKTYLENKKDDVNYIAKHPEILFEKFFSYLSWAMFLLLPLYGFLLWIGYRKFQSYFITHLIMAINQHSFMFVVFLLITILSILLPTSSDAFKNYLLILIPIYVVIGNKKLYKEKIWKILFKTLILGLIYIITISIITISIIIAVVIQNGIE